MKKTNTKTTAAREAWLQEVILADAQIAVSCMKEEESGKATSWDAFKSVMLAMGDCFASSDLTESLRLAVLKAYLSEVAEEFPNLSADEQKSKASNCAKDRRSILGNCHRFVAGGKSKAGKTIKGQGWSALKSLIDSATGGIKGFKKLLSDAIPAALKAEKREPIKKAAPKAQAPKVQAPKPESLISGVSRVQALESLDRLLTAFAVSDLLTIEKDQKLLNKLYELDDLIKLELSTLKPKGRPKMAA